MTDVIGLVLIILTGLMLFVVSRIYRLLEQMKAYDERDFEIPRAVPVNERVACEVPAEVEPRGDVKPSGIPADLGSVSDSDMKRIVEMVMQAQGGK